MKLLLKRYNGNKISPCLLSKVKHALGLKSTLPKNTMVCSQPLWEEIVDIVGSSMDCNEETIRQGKLKYERYMRPAFFEY